MTDTAPPGPGTDTPAQPQGLFEGRFAGPVAFTALVRSALAVAAREGWPEMVWSDPDFHDWPLRERAVVQSLQDWVRTGRRLRMLAHDFGAMHRCHPLFVEWRVRWDHAVDCRKCTGVERSDVPSALVAPHWALRRLDLDNCSGLASTERRWCLETGELLQSFQRHSRPAFPATTLGL